ncbi:uncharacterized protein LOC117653432 [Thrips palmi]|uniref:Uncharacterized protein LOC117653432 n=1 Tax=Thrips palmi TaxID=161013 RepID=A0A6P9AHK7_THRPL|nr:uncharacterized protein LOC117653432 [Thrips palmi]
MSQQASPAGPLLQTLVSLLLLTGLPGAVSLKNVRMRVVPAAVEAGRPATVLCEYDLENSGLYSVKFYRGTHEFYRYSAADEPHTKVFPFPQGLPSSPVNLQRSNQTQVYLGEVSPSLAGNLSCEVTTDDNFVTRMVYTNLIVAVKPEGPPSLSATKAAYDPGEVLYATCRAKPSQPAADLSFYINDKEVGHGIPEVLNTSQGLLQARLDLHLRLTEEHFAGSRDHDSLPLRCHAEVPHLFIHNQYLRLPRRTKQPIPARVTQPNGGVRLPASGGVLLLALLGVLPGLTATMR